MLQRLVRREGSTERPAIGEVLERRRVHEVEHPDRLGQLERERHLALVLDVGAGIAERADEGTSRDAHPVELDVGEPAHEIDALPGEHGEPGRIGVDEHLGWPGRRSSRSPGSRRRLRPLPRTACGPTPRGRRRPRTTTVSRSPSTPQTSLDSANAQAATVSPVISPGTTSSTSSRLPAPCERVDDDVHGEERSGRGLSAHLLGHDREVGQRVRPRDRHRRATRVRAATSTRARRRAARWHGRTRRGRPRARGWRRPVAPRR